MTLYPRCIEDLEQYIMRWEIQSSATSIYFQSCTNNDLVPKQLALPESKVPGLSLNLHDLFTGISLSLNCIYYRQYVCIYSCVQYASSRLNPPDLIPTSFVKSGPLRNLHKCRQISLQQIVVNRLRASSTETSPGR